MLAATGAATAGLPLAKLTVTGPGPALHSSVALPVADRPPANDVGVTVMESMPIGFNVIG